MKYIYSISQISKLSLTLHTFSITGLMASLFLILRTFRTINSACKCGVFPLSKILIFSILALELL